MSSERQKTILLSIQYWRAITSILRTEVLSLLKKEGFRIVVTGPYSNNEDFVREFAGENVFFERTRKASKGSGIELARRAASLLGLAASSFLTCPLPDFIRQFYFSSIDFRYLRFKGNPVLGSLGKTAFFAGRILLVLSAVVLALLLAPFIKLRILKKESILILRDKINCWVVFHNNKAHIGSIFEKYKPDLVCVSRMYYCPIENVLVIIARRRGVSSIGIYGHLDGILSSGAWVDHVNRIPYVDRLLVWSETVKEEVSRAYCLEEDRIAVTGYSGHDAYFHALREGKKLSREDLFDKAGFDQKKKLLVLAPPAIFLPSTYGASNCRIIRFIADCVEQNKFLCPCQLFIRLHPSDNLMTYYFFKKEFEGKKDIFVTLAGRDRKNGAAGDPVRFAEIMTYSDVMIAGRSGVAIDAAIFDIPTVPAITCRVFDVFEKYIFPGVELFDPQKLVQKVNDYLLDPSLDSGDRVRVVRELCGQIDGQACRRVVGEVKSMCCGNTGTAS